MSDEKGKKTQKPTSIVNENDTSEKDSETVSAADLAAKYESTSHKFMRFENLTVPSKSIGKKMKEK